MKSKVKKIVKITASSLWWLALVLLVVLLVSVLGAKLRGEVPQVFGYSVLRIVSGSMEPTIPGGTYIVVKNVDAEKVEKGNIISFYSEDPIIYGMPNTHRVEEIVREDGKLRFVTKGDANITADQVDANGDKLIGVYVTKLDGLTGISRLMNGKGFFIVIVLLQVVTVGMVAFSAIRKKGKEEDTKKE